MRWPLSKALLFIADEKKSAIELTKDIILKQCNLKDIEILDNWESGALLEWGKYLAPGVSQEDLLRTLQESYQNPESLQALLIRQLPSIIQERLQTYSGFEGLARELVTGDRQA